MCMEARIDINAYAGVKATALAFDDIKVPLAVSVFGEVKSAYIGLIVAAIGFAILGLATQTWVAYAALVPMAFMGLAMPS